MKKLQEADIIRIMREEWDARLTKLTETVDAVMSGKVGGKEKSLISPELKLRHKESQFLYTVKTVSPRGVTLTTPEGTEIEVKKDKLEKEYEID